MEIERTFVMVKPDGVQRAIVGEIISRFEKAGLKISAMRMHWVDKSLSKKHYAEHIDKPFYPEMEKFITEGPVVAIVLEGRGAITAVRKMIGTTKPEEAAPGTIRGDYAHALGDSRNLIHASANTEDAQREISLWFSDSEIHSYRRSDEIQVLHQ
jgi:nucleoside-diphosphate kinase